MLQVLHAVFQSTNESEQLPVSLIYANQTEDDILCRLELEAIAEAFPNHFKLWYTLSQIQPEEGMSVTANKWNFLSLNLNRHIIERN
jgi:cytochrome-b5 reductase